MEGKEEDEQRTQEKDPNVREGGNVRVSLRSPVLADSFFTTSASWEAIYKTVKAKQ